jgi:hypothetical protein
MSDEIDWEDDLEDEVDFDEREPIGWCCWFYDGTIRMGKTFEDAKKLAEEHPDGMLVRILYYHNRGKQIQQGLEYYLASEHEFSGEITYSGNSDSLETNEARFPGCAIIKGQWAPDKFYARVVNDAMNSDWRVERLLNEDSFLDEKIVLD